MEAVNLTALFREPDAEVRHSRYLAPSSSSTEEDVKDDDTERDEKILAAKGKKISKLLDNTRFSQNNLEELYGSAEEWRRKPLNGHTDPDRDTPSLRSYWDALMTPAVYMPIFYALRITLLVGLPLGILARHPKVMNIFPMHSVIPLYGIVDCRLNFGEQLAFSIVTLQNCCWVMMWGVANNYWNLHGHPASWWCAVLFSVFVVGLTGDFRGRRILVLHAVLILQMQNLPGGTEHTFPLRVARDLAMATGFAFFQCLFPVHSVAKDCDDTMAGGWKHIGRIARNCVKACWSEDPIECAIALGHFSTEPIQAVISTLPGKLFFVMYEFWESTLRLELRRERITLMTLCMPRLHSMTDSARAMVIKRINRIGTKNLRSSHDPSAPTSVHHDSDRHAPFSDREDHSKEPYGESARHVSYLSSTRTGSPHLRHRADSDHRQPPQSEFLPHELTREATQNTLGGSSFRVPSQQPTARLSVIMIPGYTPLWKRTSDILRPVVFTFLDALDAVLDGLGKHLNPQDTVKHVPFTALREAAMELQSKLDEVHFEVLIKSETPVDPFLYNNVFVFHLSLVVLAQRLVEYGERMENFDRRNYKSQMQRAWEFFFYDYWKSFWEELPKRMTLATPRDVRIFKDAIKMALAYGVGAMYTEHMDPENIYHFGMAILMGVGLPTPGDTMEAAVYRVTGMVCACSIAYVAIWHTPNLAGELAIALAGVFISSIFRDRPPYAHTSMYCSMLAITALNTAETKLVLLCRIVSNCFTVMTYYAIVVFVFPMNVLTVTYNAQVAAIKQVSGRFSRLVDVINQPFYRDPEQTAVIREEVFSIRAARIPMWAALGKVGEWLPKAAADPAPVGSPYPLQAMRDMYSSLRRLGSATDVISASLCVLLQVNQPTNTTAVEHILKAVGPVLQMVDCASRVLFQDFLDAIATPYEWSPALTTYHFSIFLSLSNALHSACWTAHRRNVKALRADFRARVMNRTFAAAAMSRIVDPDTLERARNMSFAPQSAENNLPIPARRQSLQPITSGFSQRADPVDPNSFHSNAGITESQPNPLNMYDDVGVPNRPPAPAAESVRFVATTNGGEGEDDDVGAVTNGSIARTVAESMAMVRSTERRNSRLIRRDTAVVGGPHPTAAPPMVSSVGDDDVSEETQVAQEQAAFEQVLEPYEQLAQEDERRAFIAPRTLDHTDERGNVSLSSEVNMVLTIMVGTDMFFAEAERLLKTMYTINEYARSRVPPPRKKKD